MLRQAFFGMGRLFEVVVSSPASLYTDIRDIRVQRLMHLRRGYWKGQEEEP